jgi:hypothetical protein
MFIPSAMPAAARAATRPAVRHKPALRLSLAATALVALGLQLLQACSFEAPRALETPQGLYQVLRGAPYVDDATVSGDRWRVIDDAHLKVDHGWTCAGAPRAASKKYVGSKLWDSADLPPNFQGTVMLNGWYLEYPNGDHHVLGLGAVIFDIAQSGNMLTWHAGGVLSDHGGDDAYVWCYEYSILAWPRRVQSPNGEPQQPYVDIRVKHAKPNGKYVYVDQNLSSNNAFTTKAFKARTPFRPKARLLAGFGVTFADDDHHLLQFAFDSGDPKLAKKRVKWRPDVILKDNSNRSYNVGQVATVLGGPSVKVFNPDFTWLESGSPQAGNYAVNNLHLTARKEAKVCLQNPDVTEHTYTYVINDVPYTWAVPMLTGWDVSVACNDEHVKKIGAWIEDWSFTPNTSPGKGTLRYTVKTILEDKSPNRELWDGVQVEVLGIDLIQPPGNA